MSEGPLTLRRADGVDRGDLSAAGNGAGNVGRTGGGDLGGDAERDRAGTRLEAGELGLWEPSRPLLVRAVESAAPRGRAIVLHLPREAVPVPARSLRHLVARPLSSDTGPAALLAHYVEGLADQAAGSVLAPQGARLGSAALSLATAFLAQLAEPAPVPASRTLELRCAIGEYIDRHLAAPWLSPAAIASAHHISVRYLHHLFRQDGGRTVGGHVRAERLDRCRADLADPRMAHRSVSRICARWGFPDAAVFGRAFKKEYGVAPGAYRRRLLSA
ncbi:helix-turn-helix domain-containing protein [Streptomyces sp. NPDC088197]|uniref:helix-turn-helix domain-containing protein n=1 Tax=Streptomyces sp. NPDC088197 TaxID=3365840 RepID=UPI00380DA045